MADESPIPDLDRIDDDELRSFVEHGEDGKRTVLIEVDLPEPQVQLETRPGSRPRLRRLSIQAVDAATDPAFERLERRLTELLGNPVPLPGAHAFAVEATAEELREICRLEDIRRLTPSRSHTPNNT